MAFLKRSTGIPLWIALAVFVAIITPILVIGARARADIAANCTAGRNLTIRTLVAESDDEPGYSWIKLNDYWTDAETVQPYVVRVRTAKAVGDEITAQIIWDCNGDHVSTTDVSSE